MSDRRHEVIPGDNKRIGKPPSPRVGSIVRVDYQAGRWEAIPRALIDDPDLSFMARWFAIWLTARPPGWEIRAGLLPYQIKDSSRPSGHLGRDSTRSLLRELETARYLVRTKYRETNGHWVWRSCFNATNNVASTMPWSTVDGASGDGTPGDITDTDLTPRLNHSKTNYYYAHEAGEGPRR